jgi:hypothetical protein
MLARPGKHDGLDRRTIPYLLTCLAAEATANPYVSDNELGRYLWTLTVPEDTDEIDEVLEQEVPGWAREKASRVLEWQESVGLRVPLH